MKKWTLCIVAICLSLLIIGAICVSAMESSPVQPTPPTVEADEGAEKVSSEPVERARVIIKAPTTPKTLVITKKDEENIELIHQKLIGEISGWDNADEALERYYTFMNNHKCHEGTVCLHVPNKNWLRTGSNVGSDDPVKATFDKINSDEDAYIEAELKLQNCEHKNSLAFSDTDTNECYIVCLDCAYKGSLDEKSAEDMSVVKTNAEARSICNHNYTSWIWDDTTNHARICTLCSRFDFGRHTIVEADCVTFEHCSVCGGRDSSWQRAYGHDMGYTFVWDSFFEDEEYTHQYRCLRRNEDDEFICDYVVSTAECDFTARYWDPQVNGYHEVYHVCPYCYIASYEPDDICEIYFHPNRACNYCNNPNSW